MLLFLIPPALCHAQDSPTAYTSACFPVNDSTSVTPPQMSIYPDAPFVPGGSYTIQITGNLPVGLPILSPACTNAYLSAIITGVADYGPPSPYVTVSGLTNTSPTLSFFTATVSGDAPVGNGVAFVLDTGSFLDSYVFIFQPAPGSNPPPNPATCTTPAITSVSPGTWVAGKSYDITIMGSCFNDISGIYIQTDAGTAVKVSKIKVVSPAEITATVKPAINEPNEAAYLLVRNNYEQSAMATVAIVSCPTPAIAEIKPSTWFAGRSYDNVVIRGTGFTTKNKAAETGCPMTTVNIAAADGSAVPVFRVSVDSDTKITLTGVAPPASDPTETATVTVGTAPSTSKPPTPAQILGNQIQCDPSMNCTQPVISTTDDSDPPAQSVVVGQPIVLATTTPTAAALAALSPPVTGLTTTWTVGGTNIGGYPIIRPTPISPTTSSATVTPTVLKTATLNSFWIYPGAGVPVTYQYCVNIPGIGNQCSLKATASFNVSGPTGEITFTTSPNPETWNVRPIVDCTANQLTLIYDLVFGWRNLGSSTCNLSLPPTTGINFTASLSDEPNSGGNISWVQVISSDVFSGVTPNGPDAPQTQGPGLDNVFPYPPTDPNVPGVTHDSPDVELISPYTRETERFTAKMYLLWTSSLPKSIPVPLGYVRWRISGAGVYQPSHPAPWIWNVAPGATETAKFSVSSDTGIQYHGLPHWTAALHNTEGEDLMGQGTESVQTDEEEEDQ